ncbi:uncharacterized protein LOC132624152 [Lycium barbarum]|uniref:uncharacterized protein LOC132624152 n=1 Tax=Lycium barbarum TaxID=112863 RepID=UPI00293E47ED|nr:uncharacterized protein LOC132624152 [Lycium barbarum]
MGRRRIQDPTEDVWSMPNWPPPVEKIFVDSLIEEMKYHLDVIPSNFHDQAWDNVVKDFSQCSGLNFDKAELKKHLSILRKHYRIVKPLYIHGGFGWDNRTKMVVVDDSVWAELHNTDLEKNTSNSSERNKRKTAEPSKSGPNKRNSVDADNSEESKSSGTDQNQKDDPYSTANCVVTLNDTPGVDQRLNNAALDLFQNQTWRETFVTMKTEKRLSWLKAMIPRKT